MVLSSSFRRKSPLVTSSTSCVLNAPKPKRYSGWEALAQHLIFVVKIYVAAEIVERHAVQARRSAGRSSCRIPCRWARPSTLVGSRRGVALPQMGQGFLLLLNNP